MRDYIMKGDKEKYYKLNISVFIQVTFFLSFSEMNFFFGNLVFGQ